MKRRRETERELRVELRRLKAALSAIHDKLHANEIDAAHEACECALAGKAVSQPNLAVTDAASGMDFSAQFNALATSHQLRACCVLLLPSKTVPNGVSIQMCGEVIACKVVESMMRGAPSTYMGDHADGVTG